MSFQTFVTESLAAINSQLNAISANAKKIFELPVQSTLDPASKIHVSRGGTSESLEVQKIIDAITEKNYSQLLEVGEITVSGLTVSIPSGASWVYEGVNHQTIAVTNITETLCDAGFLRQDILVANQSNQIVLIKGAESETIRIRPNIPLGTVLVTEIDIDDTVVGTPSTPVIGEAFIKKTDFGETVIESLISETTAASLSASVGGIRFKGTNPTFESLLLYNTSFLYPGKKFDIKNSQSVNMVVKHMTGIGQYRFAMPNELDLTLKPGEIASFYFKFTDDGYGVFEYVGIIASTTFSGTQDDVPDGTTYKQYSATEKAKLADTYTKGEVDSKVSSVYKFKENVANYAALPSTGLAIGDVYNLSDTGANYAWTGTVWDELGTTVDISGKENTSNKTATVAGNETSTTLYASIKGMVDWLTSAKIKSILGISTLSGSNTGDQDLIFPVTETGTSFSLTDAHNGKITILTASCTVTIPNDLVSGFEHTIVTLAGVTLTVALGGSVTLFNNSGTTMAEKLSCTIKNRTATNQYITAGNL